MINVLVLNGPNLNMLGKRNPNYYGDLTLEKIQKLLDEQFEEFNFEFYQSNLEGEIVNKIQNSENLFRALIINPGGYAHTSVAIRDALELVKIPKVEVHLSNLANREDFRKTSITASVCDGYISGFKELSYLAAAYIVKKILSK